MGKILVWLFTGLIIFEIWLMIQVGGEIGAGNTILAMFGTAIIGVALAQREGMKTLVTMQERLARQETPGKEMVDGVMLLLAGVFLILPGFFTDTLGFLMVFPFTRAPIRIWLMKQFRAGLASGSVRGSFHASRTVSRPASETVVDGEVLRSDEQAAGSDVRRLPHGSEEPRRGPGEDS
ncbi:FxsA family protein [Magnetofaba australis]|uniref:FxsA family protein n=1 Tax=Magnetofaba australis TaxID=1472297 RepID=UPI001301D25A|nr:FxsA family protein [Magnetofaba australis]